MTVEQGLEPYINLPGRLCGILGVNRGGRDEKGNTAQQAELTQTR